MPDNSGGEGVFLRTLQVALPADATLMSAVPEADDITRNGAATLIWRRVLGPGEKQERPVIEYVL